MLLERCKSQTPHQNIDTHQSQVTTKFVFSSSYSSFAVVVHLPVWHGRQIFFFALVWFHNVLECTKKLRRSHPLLLPLSVGQRLKMTCRGFWVWFVREMNQNCSQNSNCTKRQPEKNDHHVQMKQVCLVRTWLFNGVLETRISPRFFSTAAIGSLAVVKRQSNWLEIPMRRTPCNPWSPLSAYEAKPSGGQKQRVQNICAVQLHQHAPQLFDADMDRVFSVDESKMNYKKGGDPNPQKVKVYPVLGLCEKVFVRDKNVLESLPLFRLEVHPEACWLRFHESFLTAFVSGTRNNLSSKSQMSDQPKVLNKLTTNLTSRLKSN